MWGVIFIFGFGKQKLYLGQFCRLFSNELIEMNIGYNYSHVFSHCDITQELENNNYELLESDIALFRHVILILLLFEKGITNKLKMSTHDIGYINAQSSKLAFQDKGYDERVVELIGDWIMKKLELIMDEDLMKNAGTVNFSFYVCLNFAKRYGVEILSDISDEVRDEKEAVIFKVIMVIYVAVEKRFEEQFKMTKFLY
jgi:hypothetical protein